MMDELEFTRKDLENVTLTKMGVDALNEKVDKLSTAIKIQHATCMEHFEKQDQRICTLESCEQNRKTVTSFKEQVFSKTTAVIVVLAAAVGLLLDHCWDILKFFRGG